MAIRSKFFGGYFLAKKSGTMFESAIDHIEPPYISPDFKWEFEFNGDEAIHRANRINDVATKIGCIYITDEPHPVQAEIVTTPQHYVAALNTLKRHGYAVVGAAICKEVREPEVRC
jgi:hypothetical protein